jgi:hypothetical protein
MITKHGTRWNVRNSNRLQRGRLGICYLPPWIGLQKPSVSEFPVAWGDAADARIYPTKGDAQRIRGWLSNKNTVIMDARAELIRPVSADR